MTLRTQGGVPLGSRAQSPGVMATARVGGRRTPGPRDAAGFLSRELAGASSPSRHPQHREPLEARGGSAARNNSRTGRSCERRGRLGKGGGAASAQRALGGCSSLS